MCCTTPGARAVASPGRAYAAHANLSAPARLFQLVMIPHPSDAAQRRGRLCGPRPATRPGPSSRKGGPNTRCRSRHRFFQLSVLIRYTICTNNGVRYTDILVWYASPQCVLEYLQIQPLLGPAGPCTLVQLLTHVGGPVTTGGGARRTCRWYSSSACAARLRAAGGRVLRRRAEREKGTILQTSSTTRRPSRSRTGRRARQEGRAARIGRSRRMRMRTHAHRRRARLGPRSRGSADLPPTRVGRHAASRSSLLQAEPRRRKAACR